MSEASIATQWKKGQSGNPKGRPKKSKYPEDQDELLMQFLELLLDRRARIEALILSIFEMLERDETEPYQNLEQG